MTAVCTPVILIAAHRFKPHDAGTHTRMEEISDIQRLTMRKVVTRLMPALLVLYVIAYLDRVNVTFAQDRLEEDLGFSGAVYGFGAGMFFIGYFLLEVPEQPRAAPVRRAQVDGADHDHVGPHPRVHDVRAGRRRASTRCASCSASPRPASSRA